MGPLGFPWFDHAVVFITTLGIGSPLALIWLLSSRSEEYKIVLFGATYLIGFGTGYLILFLSRWLLRLMDE